jgi:DNA-binding MarR family transcriptional regulator
MTPDESTALIARAVLRLGRSLRAARPLGGIPLAQLGLLDSIARGGPLPAARLAEAQRLQPQSLTRHIAGLEEAGLIERVRSDADRRAILLSATEAGRNALRHDLAARRAWLEAAMQNLSQQEQDLLLAATAPMLKLAGE